MKNNSLDSSKTLLQHQRIIVNKFFLKKLYSDFYIEFKKIKIPNGPLVEIGSGAGFIKEFLPKIITSDLVKGPNIDRIFSATKIPFDDHSIAAFFMLNVFHHIRNPEKALREMERCLKKGGKIVMIDTYNSPWSRFVYQNFHHEDFDVKSGWKIRGKGRLSSANAAMPWIVFVRDKKNFENRFPNLKIEKMIPHTPFRYILSGGLSKPQLLPSTTYSFVLWFEKMISPLNKLLGMFATIVIKKV